MFVAALDWLVVDRGVVRAGQHLGVPWVHPGQRLVARHAHAPPRGRAAAPADVADGVRVGPGEEVHRAGRRDDDLARALEAPASQQTVEFG